MTYASLVGTLILTLLLTMPAASESRRALAGLGPEIRQIVNSTMQIALETHLSGRGRMWSSPKYGFSGRVTPVRTWRTRSGHFCRAFVEIVRLPSGSERIGRGRACRNEAGEWIRT
jgi:surface antigen